MYGQSVAPQSPWLLHDSLLRLGKSSPVRRAAWPVLLTLDRKRSERVGLGRGRDQQKAAQA